MVKKILAPIFALIILIPVFACTRQGNDPGGLTTGKTANEGSYVADYLPGETFDGKEFRVGVFSGNRFVFTQEEADNIYSAAVYKRNMVIENRYDIAFVESVLGSGYDELFYAYMDNFTAQTGDFEIAKNIMRNAWLAAVQGAVTPVSSLEYCDTTQPWYLQYVNEALTVDDTLMFAYSYEADTVTRALIGVFFNKTVLEDNVTLENPYDLVKNNNWTVDKFLSMARAAVKDVNGDGEYDIDSPDIFGIICEDDMYSPSLWVGAGFTLVEKDEDGMPYFSAATNDRLISLLNKAFDYYTEYGVVFEGFTNRGQTWNTVVADNKSFTEDHSLFYIGGIYQWESMTDMISDFGIVPLPKYNEEQKEFYTRVCDGHASCVPVTGTDLRFTSIILEALAVESLNIVNPAYFEEAIEARYLRDPEESMDIIRMMQANVRLDLGDSIWMSTARNPIVVDCFRNEKRTFASTLEKYAPVMNKLISDDVERINTIIELF